MGEEGEMVDNRENALKVIKDWIRLGCCKSLWWLWGFPFLLVPFTPLVVVRVDGAAMSESPHVLLSYR